MATNKKYTIFQSLDKAITGNWNPQDTLANHVNSYDLSGNAGTIYRTTDKDEYETKKLELQQDRYLKDRWVKANVNLNVTAYAGLNNVKLMYRDADLMASAPEIAAALDIYAGESTIPFDNGQIVKVQSSSERVKSILEDLFTNRLNLNLTAPMVIRAMCKYGNQFMLLDIDNKYGVKNWKQMPVFNVERIENGIQNPYTAAASLSSGQIDPQKADLSTKFIWLDADNAQVPFRDWQIAHFRLLSDSMYLPYGCSSLNGARRHWRQLALMEDMMLIYRLERSVERRVYKIYVGAIDDADVQAYVDEIANNFKRTPIIDPLTGQLDLRKNILSVDNDLFIPTRSENAPTPVDTLPAGNNLTAMDDIKYVQNKVLTALRIPKQFLNFEESAGDGGNLALQDIRFTRTINSFQQAFLMELTKVAIIHLYLLGFDDDLTNFSLSMNNPSTQAEQLKIDTISKKVSAIRDAVSDPGNGIQPMSLTRALKNIMGWSEKEIKENLEEIRLEKALANELQMTAQIIKRTGIFDRVDRIYGETGSQYQDQQGGGQQGDDMGGGAPMGGGGGDFGGGLDDIGAPGADDTGEIGGEEGSMPTADMDAGQGGISDGTPMESDRKNGNLLTESFDRMIENYIKEESKGETLIKRSNVYDKAFLINEEVRSMVNELDEFIGE